MRAEIMRTERVVETMRKETGVIEQWMIEVVDMRVIERRMTAEVTEGKRRVIVLERIIARVTDGKRAVKVIEEGMTAGVRGIMIVGVREDMRMDQEQQKGAENTGATPYHQILTLTVNLKRNKKVETSIGQDMTVLIPKLKFPDIRQAKGLKVEADEITSPKISITNPVNQRGGSTNHHTRKGTIVLI